MQAYGPGYGKTKDLVMTAMSLEKTSTRALEDF